MANEAQTGCRLIAVRIYSVKSVVLRDPHQNEAPTQSE